MRLLSLIILPVLTKYEADSSRSGMLCQQVVTLIVSDCGGGDGDGDGGSEQDP